MEEQQVVFPRLADDLVGARHAVRPHPRLDRHRRIRGAITETQRRRVGHPHVIVAAVERDGVRCIRHRRVLDQHDH